MKILTFLSFFLFTINSFCQKWESYTTSNSGIPSNSVTGIAAAENGKIWISTLSGIAGFDSQWRSYGINNSSYSFDEIKHIWCTDGLIWVGTDTRGLWSFDGSNKWTDYSAYSSGNGIEGFGIDPQDTIWVLDKFGNFSKWMDYYWVDVLDFIDHPNSLFIDANGNKWVMSGNMGLIRYSNGETFYFNDPWDENSPNYIPDASLFCMVRDSHGNYWIGSDNKGLMKFDGSEFTYFDTSNSNICSNKIRALAIDENDILWMGTYDGGVSKYDGTQWTNYNAVNSPLPSNSINAILIANDNKIWMAGNQGILVLDENADNSGGTLPNAPTDLNLKDISVAEVELHWTDNSTNETGFIVERSVNNQTNFQQIKFLVANTTTFTDFTVNSVNTYYYRIAAANSVDTSAYSNIGKIKPKYCAVNKFSYSCYANVTRMDFGDIHKTVFNSLNGYYDYLDLNTEVRPGSTLLMTVTFDRYSITSDKYIAGEIYIDWNADGDFDDTNERVFQDLNIPGKKTFSFPVHVPSTAQKGITRIRTRADDDAYSTLGSCGYAEETQDYTLIISDGIPITEPTDFNAFGLTSRSIYLSWNDNSYSETGYKILRSSDSIHFDKSFLTGSDVVEFIDTTLSADTKYYYKVEAVSHSDTSEFSVIMAASTLSMDFVKVTQGDIASFRGFTVGAFWGDYNNDNKTDVFTSGDNVLYSNENNVLNYIEQPFFESGSAAWGDYNNDGYLDLFTTSYNYGGGTPYNLLYKNNGDNSFTPLTPFESDGRVTNCVWLDFNNDGKLDIFLSYLDLNYGKFYLNNGDDTFSDSLIIPGASGFSTFADYDNDGDLDLFAAGYSKNQLFENNGDGTFTKNTYTIVSFFDEFSNGASWGDIDNDGDLDLFVANGRSDDQNNSLYINYGHGNFSKVFDGNIVMDGGQSYGSSFCDFDNDGNLDIVVANFDKKNFFYRGKGDGTFILVERSAVMNEFSEINSSDIPSMACACADYNQDGFEDLLIATNNGFENLLYKNSGNSNNWVKLKLKGVESNRSAIGAKVRIKVGNAVQYREVTSQSGFAGQNELPVIFGLGRNTMVDTVRILWPSGIKQVLTHVEANQSLEITETLTSDISDKPDNRDIMVFPNPFSTYLTITNNGSGTPLDIDLIDINGKLIKTLHSDSNRVDLNTADLSKGVYLLRIRNQESILTQKIVKE